MGAMKWLGRQIGSVRNVPTRQSDLDREFAFHVDMETESLIASGVPHAEARRRAMQSFGGIDRYQEEMRDGWLRRWLADVGSDVRFAVRGLRRSPIFALTAIATLAIGMGGTAAVLTLVDKVLIAKLPYADENSIVRIYNQDSPTNRWSLSAADVIAIAQWQKSFTAVVGIRAGEMALSGHGDPEWVRAGRATEGLFATFGVSPSRGRGFQPSDSLGGSPAVVVISDALAHRRFGSTDAVGQSITLNGVSHAIIGVLPTGMKSIGGITADVWPLLRLETPTRRGPFGIAMFAHMKPGVSITAAKTDLNDVLHRLFTLYASGTGDKSARLVPFALRDIMFGSARTSLGVLFGAVALVLLIALANVTNLVLVRASGRRREIALRVALGAGRSRLTRLMLTENVVLSLIGGVLAIVIAGATLAALRAIGPTMPRIETARIDAATMAITLLMSVACGVAIALYPLALTTLRGVSEALRGGDRRSSAGHGTRTFQNVLVVAEFALALPLFAAAALLLHSFLALQNVDSGVDARNVISIRVSLPGAQYPDQNAQLSFWTRTLDAVRSIPGVQTVGLTTSLPPDNQGNTNNFDLIDFPVAPGASQHVAPWGTATSDYFNALGVHLIAGRLFNDHDGMTSPPVLIVSKAWAGHYFPGQSAVGRQLIEGGCTSCPHSTVIGVVGDIKYSGLSGDGEGVYNPATQGQINSMYVIAKVRSDPHNMIDPIRAQIHSIDPNLPLGDTELMSDHIATTVTEPRHWTLLVGGFAAIAVILAGLGVFGVMSYIVAQQQREIGVRLALGAAPSAVLALVLRRGLILACVGTLIGIGISTQGTRVLQHVLFNVSPSDPRTLAAVAAMLVGVATIACYFPGRRAAKVDPVRVIAGD